MESTRIDSRENIMEQIIGFLFRYFWLAAIGVNLINGVIMWVRAQRQIRQDPELAPGYAHLVLGFTVWTSIPFILMGIGIVYGGLPTIFAYLRPSSGDPFVLLFWLVNFVLYAVVGTYWLFFGGGIAFLQKYQGVLSGSAPVDSMGFRLRWLLQVLWIVVAFAVLYYWVDVPAIEFLPFDGQYLR